MNWRLISVITLLTLFPAGIFSAEADTSNGFYFTTLYEVPTTSVKNQARTGTCWSFAGASFIETEIMRITGDSIDISEMFFVRMNYPQKAIKYVRYHGNANIESGSLFGDVLRIVREQGFVPETVYSGLHAGDVQHDHTELDAVLKASLDAIITNRSRKISPAWPQVVNSLLDIYLGPKPANFTHSNQSYTPESFRAKYQFDTNDYIEITSYNHHPFDTEIVLEIPDNWAGNRYLNVPLDKYMEIIDRALEHGYSVGFDGDVSEKSFKRKLGVAILPELVWELRTEAERDSICRNPEPEVMVDQKIRQTSFDNYTSKDDHLMHIVGLAKDQNGTKYYKTKNSWGTKDSAFDGYIYMSESYVRSKAISILVSKEVLDK